MTTVDRQRAESHVNVRLLYFDPLPDGCIRAMEAASEISVLLETTSDISRLPEAFRACRPHALIVAFRGVSFGLVELAQCLADIDARVPVLLSGPVEAANDTAFRTFLIRHRLDVRGTVQICERVRELQLVLLTAARTASRLAPS